MESHPAHVLILTASFQEMLTTTDVRERPIITVLEET